MPLRDGRRSRDKRNRRANAASTRKPRNKRRRETFPETAKVIGQWPLEAPR
jgi:hypothetical protein